MNYKNIIAADKQRTGGGSFFLILLRVAHYTTNPILRFVCRIGLLWYEKCYGLEIPYNAQIGKGLYIGHAYNITINPKTIIGDNCNIHRGCLMGQQNRGKHQGAPSIGNRVWVGINACIVGSVTIGDDVLIAPNSFVNCDIPSHSVVFGNPCVIKHRDNATENYINHLAD